MTKRSARAVAFLSAVVIAGALMTERGEAHKPITSKYTYNHDVFPIFRERCAQCHVPGGVAPMSLMTYEEAFPWAESIRAELVAAHMPPATAEDGVGDVVHARALSPKELDVILTWASGGNPRGPLDEQLPAVALKNEWTLGAPDLALPIPSAFTLTADSTDATNDITLATNLKESRWVRAVDLLPGNPAIVRTATIALKDAPDVVLARWIPGGEGSARSANGVGFHLPANAELTIRIRYRKTWSYEGKAMNDRSTIGLYFAPATASDLQALTPIAIASSQIPSTIGGTFTFAQTLDRDVDAFAISPDQVPDNLTLDVTAVRPDGSRTPLIRFATRPDWKRRYWFGRTLALPRGTRIEVNGTVGDPDLVAAAFGGPVSPEKTASPTVVKLTLDVAAAQSRTAAP